MAFSMRSTALSQVRGWTVFICGRLAENDRRMNASYGNPFRRARRRATIRRDTSPDGFSPGRPNPVIVDRK